MAEQPSHELNGRYEDSNSKIDPVNTKFAPVKPPPVSFIPSITREAFPSITNVPELDTPLVKHSNYAPSPTSLTAMSNKNNPKPSVPLLLGCITKKKLDCEIAKQKLRSLYGRNMDQETFRELFCKQKEPQKSSLSTPHEEESTLKESEVIETPKEKLKGLPPLPMPSKEVKPIEGLKPPKRSSGTGITDPDQTIFKNRLASPESPRNQKPYYIFPLVNTGDVDPFSGKPRVTQRYKKGKMCRSATSLTSMFDRYNSKPPEQFISGCITKKKIDYEIAKQNLRSLYGGNMDLETFRDLFCKKEEPKESNLSPPQDEEPTPEESEEEIIEVPKEVKPKESLKQPESSPETSITDPDQPILKKRMTSPKVEKTEELPPSPLPPKGEKPKERLKPPTRPPGRGITDPDHPILKNRMSSPGIPRNAKPYILPAVNTGEVEFFPGKPRITQRYKGEEISRAARKIPIVDEADNRFAVKARSAS